jgi:hypothetical protein
MKILSVAVMILLPATVWGQQRPLVAELNRALSEAETRCGSDSACKDRAFALYAKASVEDNNCRRAHDDLQAYVKCSEPAARDAVEKIAAVMPSPTQPKK